MDEQSISFVSTPTISMTERIPRVTSRGTVASPSSSHPLVVIVWV
ncbi:hypothetical protein [Streptomyces scopuliridis]